MYEHYSNTSLRVTIQSLFCNTVWLLVFVVIELVGP